MIRFQFSLPTTFVVTTACCLLMAWWVPTRDKVRFAEIYFVCWHPYLDNLRVTTERQFYDLLGDEGDVRRDIFDWPDFSESDVIPVPPNGLAGEPSAEYRMETLGRPVNVGFQNTPLPEVVAFLREQCEIELQQDAKEFASAGVNSDMPITFQARGILLRDALHSMLEPRGLTAVVGEEVVCITTQSRTQWAYGPSILDRKDWFDYRQPKLGHRVRCGGRLVFPTSFVGPTEPDSRAVGYTVPKGAWVLFVTEPIATTVDACYTIGVVLTALLLMAHIERRRRRCQQELATKQDASLMVQTVCRRQNQE